MASRRTRIKGIANIPQRRKNTSCEEKCNENNLSSNNQDEDKEIKKIIPSTNESSDISVKTESLGVSKDVKNCNGVQNSEANTKFTSYDVNENEKEKIVNQTSENISKVIETEKTVDIQNVEQPKPATKRRAFIKPSVSANVVNRKSKQKTEKIKSETITAANIQPEVNKTEITNKSIQEISTESNQNDNIGQEVTLDEVHLTPTSRVSEHEVPSEKGVKKIIPYATSNTFNSDTEYPPPPPSPSKINRSRIKAIPRLGYRKTSFSASESEDESKRNYNRNRNDSVCSTASGVPESIADCMSPQRPKDFNTIVPKKCIRTEQSRKVAEARRDFQRRFGTNKPDRQKLTMIDLLFYNPTTNPMVNEAKSKPDEETEQMDTEQVNVESEKVDDLQENPEVAEAGKSDEENEVPVPQIKIGPSGEIILDEKSLVIEDKKGKKQREELQKTKLVDGDVDTGYGIYKRHKRSKEWTHRETIRFYKALNKIGTDFTLMCELFPRRTRRELKQKFKREEKTNRALIDKAVTQPCTFQYAELKHEADMEEKELEELRRQKEEEVKLKQQRNEERMLKRKTAIEKAEMNKKLEFSSSSNKPSTEPKKPSKKRGRPKKLSIESVLEDSDADVSDVTTQSESEGGEEVIPQKRTRSSRMSTVTKKESPTDNLDKEKDKEKTTPEPTNIEPGSVMVITEKGPTGEPVHKLYMITEANDNFSLKLDSEVVSKGIQLRKGLAVQKLLTITENPNRTIPADETVTTMRSIPKEMDEVQQSMGVSTVNGEIVEGETFVCKPSTSGESAVLKENLNLEPSNSEGSAKYSYEAPEFSSEPSTSKKGMRKELWSIMSNSIVGTSGEVVDREYVPTEEGLDMESD